MAMPVVDTEYLKQIDKARRQLRGFIANKNCAPIMLRLAYSTPPLSLYTSSQLQFQSTRYCVYNLDVLIL